MKVKTVVIKPGTILCWKEYNIFTKLWNKLTKKVLPVNKFIVVPFEAELLTINKYKTIAYEPIRKYNKQEINRLKILLKSINDNSNWDDIVYTINLIRPNTFANSLAIEESKYYKKRDLNVESTEYIYCIK